MIGLIVELLVSVLLATTIGYSIVLERRLRRMRADDQQMRKTIVDLVTATETAERAIVSLKTLVADCDRTLAASLRDAEHRSVELAEHIRSGDDVIARIARIVETAKGGSPAPAAAAAPAPVVAVARTQPAEVKPQSRLAGTLAAAQAFAERARQRVEGKAA
jgi:hypothetical protein